MEYGLANVMEQYEKKYKARQLLGPVPESDFQSFSNNNNNSNINLGSTLAMSKSSGLL